MTRQLQLYLDRLRHRLAYLDALPQLTLLGFLSGLVAALVIIIFRLLIELPLAHVLGGDSEGFETLPPLVRFCLPILGAIIIALIFRRLDPKDRQVSVSHVIERVHHHQARLPLRNLIVQFLVGAIALLSGQSVGREGPAVHLGAGTASQLGQWLKLPNNSLRTLVGCGIASAIAASFNTPMAGVIFAMEVILMEYSIAGFVPVILASVTGATMAQLTFGSEPAFSVAPLQLSSLIELPLIIGCGIIIAVFATTMTRLHLIAARLQTINITIRLLLVGIVTGLVALYLPQVMGVGYDTIEATMQGEIALGLLLSIAIAKLLLTTFSVGLGMPGGLIGPMLFIGACVGGALGLIAEIMLPESGANASFYALLGMGAMMGAVLNAPLAALITILELSYNPNIIFPAMIITVTSVVTTRQIFGCNNIFIEQLQRVGIQLNSGTLNQVLERIGVRSVMSTQFTLCHQSMNQQTLLSILEGQDKDRQPDWLVVSKERGGLALLATKDISNTMENLETPEGDINLLSLKIRSWQLQPIAQEASLLDARKLFEDSMADALYVERYSPALKSLPLTAVAGIVMPDMIEGVYR